jgi:hypothetical protein
MSVNAMIDPVISMFEKSISSRVCRNSVRLKEEVVSTPWKMTSAGQERLRF